MSDDNLLDSIRVISDGINAINARLADMLPVSGYNELERRRDAAIERLHLLVKLFVKGSTKRFIKADNELAVANEEMKRTLRELEDLQGTIDVVTRFVGAIDRFIAAIGQVV